MKYMFFKFNSKQSNRSVNETSSNPDSCKVISIQPYIDKRNDNINDKITKFFFDSVHKNYLRSR